MPQLTISHHNKHIAPRPVTLPLPSPIYEISTVLPFNFVLSPPAAGCHRGHAQTFNHFCQNKQMHNIVVLGFVNFGILAEQLSN